MGTSPQIGVRGLRLLPNHFAVERGATLVASNCIIPSKNVMEPRRGQPKLGYTFGSGGSPVARAMHVFNGTLLVWRDTDNALAYDTGSAFTDLSGSYSPPDATTLAMKFADIAKSCYFTTSVAPYAMASPSSTPRAAGLPRPRDLAFVEDGVTTVGTRLTGNPNAAGSWFTANRAVGYRALLGLKDANDVIHLGAPTGRLVVQNPADLTIAAGGVVRAANVVTVTLAAGQTHGYRYGDLVNLTATGADVANFANNTNRFITAVTATSYTYGDVAANYTNVNAVVYTSGIKATQVQVLLPSGLTAGSHFVQLHRTLMSPTAGSDPLDEHRLVFERFITATDISNGYVIIPDTCPESLFLGTPLYTNPTSGQGVLQANTRPPIANDICVWDNRLWMAQTTDRHRLQFRLLGVGSPNGFQSGDFICIGPHALRAGTDFTAVTTLTTPSQNIQATVAAFIRAYNARIGSAFVAPAPSALASAYMLEDGSVYPASILVEEDAIGGATIYAGCSRSSAIAERLPTATQVTVASTARTLGTTVTVRATAHGFTAGDVIMLATNFPDGNFPEGLKTVATVVDANNFTYAETGANVVMTGWYAVYKASYASSSNKLPLRYSKQLEPESCPLVNYPTGLPDWATVLRILPLRDKLYVFLKYGDIYTVSGTWPYQVSKMDDTAMLIAADTLVSHAGRLHALTTQGVAAISDGGVEVLSYDVEPGLDPIEGGGLATVRQYAFAVSYESDRQYQLWLPSSNGQAFCDTAYVYHSLARDWTTWSQNVTCGLIHPVTGKLTLGCSDTRTLRVENKSYRRDDYSENRSFPNCTYDHQGATGSVFSYDAGWPYLSVGDFLWVPAGGALANNGIVGPVKIVSIGGGFLEVDSSTLGAVVVALGGGFPVPLRFDTPLSTGVSLVPDFALTADLEKQWRESKFHFSFWDVQAPVFRFITEKNSLQNAYPGGSATGKWPDYSGVLENSSLPPVVLRVDIPEECERGVLLYPVFLTNEPLQLWRFCGATHTAEPVSERTGT